jgi:WD40 repeat protein
MSPDDQKRYDAFLSYNSLDRLAVEEVARRLSGDGLELYLEVWKLAPGEEFQPALAAALQKSKTCVMFLGPSGLGPWQKQELQVAIDTKVREEGFRVIPVLLPGAERPRRGDVAHLDFLINASWVEFLKTLDDDDAFRSLVWGITGTKPLSSTDVQNEGICPYRGLEAFRPDDAMLFFGRDNLSGWLVSALRRAVRAEEEVRFLGVLGPSGSGKSSVVLAGLVPKLRAGAIEGSQRWPVAILRPGGDPLGNLAAGAASRFLAPGALPDSAQVLKLADDLRDDERALHVFAQMVLRDQPEDVRLVVVVDQFEEVFTHRPQVDRARRYFEHARTSFFANLLRAAAAPSGRVAVILTMRSDFLSACALFPQLSAVLSAHQELVGPMAEEELRQAIERPAFIAGCEVEPALTERLLADVEGQPGALPLLQFALTEVWKKRDVRRLTLRAYNLMGEKEGKPSGIEGALEHRANEIYGGLKPEDQDLCRWIFLRLVQPGEGMEDTKRRVPYRELFPDDPAKAEAVRKLIRTLADRDARLITTGATDATDGAVEVAHEALIRGWTRLRQWVDAERAGLRTQRRLSEAAHEWALAGPGHKEDYLFSGARLATCREWAELRRNELSTIEAAFLAASDEAERQREQDELENERRLRQAAEGARESERKRAEEAEAREHEVEARKRDSEAAAKRQEQLGRRIVAAALVACVFAVVAGVSAVRAIKARNDAVVNEEKAKAQTKIANSRQIAAISESRRERLLDRSLLLGVEALRIENTLEARTALFSALLARPQLSSFLRADEGPIESVAFSLNGTILVAGYSGRDGGGGLVLWDVDRRTRLIAEPLAVAKRGCKSVAFSPDRKTLAAGFDSFDSADGGVLLWEVAPRTKLTTEWLAVAEGGVESIAFSPDGTTLAAGYSSDLGGVVLWDVARRTRLMAEPLPLTEGGAVSTVAFSPDGKTLAAGYVPLGSKRGGVVLWDVARRARLTAEPQAMADEGFVSSVAFSPDGMTMAAGYDRGGMALWDVALRTRLMAERLAEGDVSSVTFSADGKTLAAGFSRGPDGGGVVLWDVVERTRLMAKPLAWAGSVSSVAFSPDGTTLASGYNGGVALWDLARRTPQVAEPLAVAEGHIQSVAFSPDGTTLAAGYGGHDDGGVLLWDVARRTRLVALPLAVAESGVTGVAFSPDGKTLAAGYGRHVIGGDDDGGVMLWDVANRTRLIAEPALAEGGIQKVALSPDGRTLLAVGFSITSHGGGVMLYDVKRRTRLMTERLNTPGRISSVAFNPDGKTLAVGYENHEGGGVSLWEVAPRLRLVAEALALDKDTVKGLAFSRDGKILAAGGTSGSVALLDAAQQSRLMAEILVLSVAFSPDGKTLAAGGYGGVILWCDVAGRTRLVAEPLAVSEGAVSSVTFSPDGKTLAAGYHVGPDKGGVLLLDFDLGSWRRLAGRIANRNLTRDEWRQYFPDEPYRPTFDDLPMPPEVNPSSPSATTSAARDVPKADAE